MDSVVYVWPMHLIGALYADLHEGKKPDHPFQMDVVSAQEDGAEATLCTLKFQVASPYSRSAEINLQVSGQSNLGIWDAQRLALRSMVEALRTEHGIFVADYSCVLLSERRPVYECMRKGVDDFSLCYGQLHEILTACHSCIIWCVKELASWVRRPHGADEIEELVAVSGYMASLREAGTAMFNELGLSTRLVDVVLHRDAVTEDQRRVGETVPFPMHIDWEASYFMVRTVYEQAIKKMNCQVVTKRCEQGEDGQYKAAIEVSVHPYTFVASSETKFSAMAKLMFTIVNHVHVVLGHVIMDLNYSVCHHEETFIKHYEQKMQGILRSGQLLRNYLSKFEDAFDRWTDDVIAQISDNKACMFVVSVIQICSAQLRSLSLTFEDTWEKFLNVKVQRDAIVSSIAGPL